MARLACAEVFDPSEVAVLHLCARVVRRCFLVGVDPIAGKKPRSSHALPQTQKTGQVARRAK